VLISVPLAHLQVVLQKTAEAGIPAKELGSGGGTRLVVEGLFDVSVADAVTAWRGALPAAFAAQA
jgi:phosphoribosylformylglycinamidine synthase